MLSKFYTDLKAKRGDFEIVFVSSGGFPASRCELLSWPDG
jgi:hypothetical protein